MKRKIENTIEEKLKNSDKILLIEGARQVGKTYIVREVGKKLFKNFIEINFVDDIVQEKLFSSVKNIDDFYFKVSSKFGEKLGSYEDTIIFIDEIQMYPYFFTFLKFLREDKKYHFIASGSLLGIELKKTTSIPIGSIEIIKMTQLDFEEFLYANDVNIEFVDILKRKYTDRESLDTSMHEKMLDYFKKYLIVGGLPEAVKIYVKEKNVAKIREVQENIYNFYGDDASKYDERRKFKTKLVYSLIPSQLENKKKRLIVQNIENKKYKKIKEYEEEFEYLINSGISLSVNAVANPHFPLLESEKKSLLKMYLNDVGILTMLLYKNNINAVLNNENSINLGSVYESVVAQELNAHGYKLYYYDNKKVGEVDYIIDDYEHLSVLPIEVKSGKDYTVHSALNNLLSIKEYGIKKAIVLHNDNIFEEKNNILYMPVYNIMFV